MAHTFTDLLYHLVFSTKNRLPQIDDRWKDDLFAYLGGTVSGIGGSAMIVNGTADHVHLLVVLPQTMAVADALRAVKANSSGWVHEHCSGRRDFGWQTGYGAFTVSESRRESVMRYIARQEEHHRTVTFEDEFLTLLTRHRISYDPRFVLG